MKKLSEVMEKSRNQSVMNIIGKDEFEKAMISTQLKFFPIGADAVKVRYSDPNDIGWIIEHNGIKIEKVIKVIFQSMANRGIFIQLFQVEVNLLESGHNRFELKFQILNMEVEGPDCDPHGGMDA